MTDDWRQHLLTTPAEIRTLLQGVSRVAVLGMRPASHSHKAAFYVPQALQDMGLTIVPVVVHGHEDAEILGAPVYRRLVDVPGQLDLVDVFRRSEDIPAHVELEQMVLFGHEIRRQGRRREHRNGQDAVPTLQSETPREVMPRLRFAPDPREVSTSTDAPERRDSCSRSSANGE